MAGLQAGRRDRAGRRPPGDGRSRLRTGPVGSRRRRGGSRARASARERIETLSLKLAAATAEMASAGGTGNIVVHSDAGQLWPQFRNRPTPIAESQRIWESIGIRVLKIARTNPVLMNSKYEGGLQVVSVRPDSPASRSGIQQRDVLVGLDRYQTVKTTDVCLRARSSRDRLRAVPRLSLERHALRRHGARQRPAALRRSRKSIPAPVKMRRKCPVASFSSAADARL